MEHVLDLPEIAKAVALSFSLLAASAPAATLAYPLNLSAGWNLTGNAPSYRLSDDGKTVTDQVTQLTWMRAPNLTRTTPTAFDKKP